MLGTHLNRSTAEVAITARPAPELIDRPWRPVPGPVDREHFFAAQARNRRATWRLTALCLVGTALMGIPMSAVITPLVLAAVVLVGDLINLVVPGVDLLYLVAHADQRPPSAGLSDFQVGAVLAIALLGPGALVMALAWLGTRRLLTPRRSRGARACARRPATTSGGL